MMSFCRTATPTHEKYLSSLSALYWLQLQLSSPSPSLHPLKLSLSVHFMTNAALSLPRVLLSTLPRLHPLPLPLTLSSLISAHSLLLLLLFCISVLSLALMHHRGVLFQKRQTHHWKIVTQNGDWNGSRSHFEIY